MSITRGMTPVVLFIGASAALIATPVSAQEQRTVASINGVPFTQEQLLTYARATSPQSNLQDKNVRDQLLQSFIGRELMYQEALKKKIEQQPEVQNSLEETRHAVIAQAYVAQLLKERPITEAMAREVYDKQIASRAGIEYQTRHILVQSEDEAKEAISRLKKGEDFYKLAQLVSKDSSAIRGGDLGWLRAEKMPAPFGEALTKLKPGKFTTSPVKTEAGWHVIQLDANRPTQVPPFDKVRNQLIKMMQDQIINQHLSELQNSAKLELIKK